MMKYKQKLDQDRKTGTEDLQSPALKQQDLFTTSTVLSQESTSMEKAGQTHTELFNPNKLYRSTDPYTSRAAAFLLPTGKRRQFVLDLIEKAGEEGVTAKEMISAHPEMSSSSISSRPNELDKLGLVFYQGDKRNGSRVIRHIKCISLAEGT